MKIQRSCGTPADAKKTQGGLRRIVCWLFFVGSVVVAVGAIASPRANQGLVEVSNALPATTIVVTNTNDSGPGSLRNALEIAQDGDTIDATGVSGTILLTSGGLLFGRNVTINGPGAGNLAINGNATFRVFENFAFDATISGVTITNGFTADTLHGGGGILNRGGLTITDSNIVNNVGRAYGGGITSINAAPLTVTNSAISGNNSAFHGGGIAICCGVTLTITNSVITGNNSSLGGGIHADTGATVTVGSSTISHNMGGCYAGGGIFTTGNANLVVMNSTISDNTATHTFGQCGLQSAYGGGIANIGSGTLIITNSTISGNLVEAPTGLGGGVYDSSGTLTVTNTTISGNHGALWGGGIYNDYQTNLNVTNSTISDNSSSLTGGAIYNFEGAAQIGDSVLNADGSGGTIFNNGGTFSSLGYNLASDNGGGVLTGPGDQITPIPCLVRCRTTGDPHLHTRCCQVARL